MKIFRRMNSHESFKREYRLDKDTVRNLNAAIERELGHLEGLRLEMGQIISEDSPISRRAKGSILHDFYNGCERIFKAIANEFLEKAQ